MRKKEILSITTPVPKKPYDTSVVQINVKEEKHIIIDIYSKNEPYYRMVMNKDEFANYSYVDEKWDCKNSWDNPHRRDIYAMKINDGGMKIIDRFLKYSKVSGSGYLKIAADKVFAIWSNIDSKKGMKKAEREEAKRLELEALMPELSTGAEYFLESRAEHSNIIYYKRKHHKAHYWCCRCGKEYDRYIGVDESYPSMPQEPIPSLDNIELCKCCGHLGKLKYEGRAKIDKNYYPSLVYQVAADGTLIVRGYVTITETCIGTPMNMKVVEEDRWYLQRKQVKHYTKINWQGRTWGEYATDVRYDKSYGLKEALENSALKYFPMEDIGMLSDTRSEWTKLQALIAYARCPMLESAMKAGLKDVAKWIYWNGGSVGKDFDKKSTSLLGFLKISRPEYKWVLAQAGSDRTALNCIKVMHKVSGTLEDIDLIRKYYGGYNDYAEGLDMVTENQSLIKMDNYLEKQRAIYQEKGRLGDIRQIFIEYRDYLRERKALGDDLTNDVYLHPKDLYETHSRIRIEAERRENEMYESEMQHKYTAISKVSAKISRKYTWNKDGFLIRPANDAREIVLEGKILHHCVGSDNQRYMKNYNEGKSFILVLRRAADENVPYITIEIDGTNIKQWYGEHDHKPDKETIEPLLKEYVKWLKSKKKIKKTA